jgi:type I restriction enzyme S subunit
MISDEIPRRKLDSVATRVSGHTPSKTNCEYWNGGIPWVSLTDTSKLDNRYISHTAKEVSDEGIRNSSAVIHPPGLVILSRDARVGCSAITTRSMAVSQHFIGWICSDAILNKYLYYVFQKWKPKFEAIAMGSTIPTIGVPFFRDLEIPVPPMDEQKRIAKMLESIDADIQDMERKISCLEVLMNGLSSDLLSGRKRVSI